MAIEKPTLDGVVASTTTDTASVDTPETSSTVSDAIQTHLDAFNTATSDDTEVVPAEPVNEDVPVEPAETAVTTPIVPDAHRRSAKARGWTDDEIDGFASADVELAQKTFERMHTSRIQEVNEWAAQGRETRKTPVSPTPTTPTEPTESVLKPIDVVAMVTKYGNDNEELIRELATPINAAIDALTPLIKDATENASRTRETQQQVLAKTIDDFFGNTSMAAFEPVYGKTWDALTPEQMKKRDTVLEMADALVAGARLQGRGLDIVEAMTMAHDVVASSAKETAIRDDIRKTVVKRAKSITLKPNSSGTKPSSGSRPKDEQELLARTDERLAKIFG